MASPIVTNSSAALNSKTLLVAETSASITGGLIPATDAVQVGWVLRKVTALTNAQIKALPTTPVDVIAAPAANFRILLISAILQITSTGHTYTNINAAGLAHLQYSSAGSDPLSNWIGNDAGSSPVLGDFTRLLNGGVRSAYFQPFTQVATPVTSQWGNAAYVHTSNYSAESVQLVFDNGGSGALTGGDVANTGSVTAIYLVVPA